METVVLTDKRGRWTTVREPTVLHIGHAMDNVLKLSTAVPFISKRRKLSKV